MSRAISESLTLLSETLGNCKTNLKEKSVENVDNIKISDVDEKIAEIQAGGGGLEIDTSQLDPNASIVVIFTNIFEYRITDLYINDRKVSNDQLSEGYTSYIGHNGQIILLATQQTGEVTIKVDLEYEYDSYSEEFKNINLTKGKLICVKTYSY